MKNWITGLLVVLALSLSNACFCANYGECYKYIGDSEAKILKIYGDPTGVMRSVSISNWHLLLYNFGTVKHFFIMSEDSKGSTLDHYVRTYPEGFRPLFKDIDYYSTKKPKEILWDAGAVIKPVWYVHKHWETTDYTYDLNLAIIVTLFAKTSLKYDLNKKEMVPTLEKSYANMECGAVSIMTKEEYEDFKPRCDPDLFGSVPGVIRY